MKTERCEYAESEGLQAQFGLYECHKVEYCKDKISYGNGKYCGVELKRINKNGDL